jgi:hypothetical protein
VKFPKLRYPIHTKGLLQEERLILLAYDIAYRSRAAIKGVDLGWDKQDLEHDLDANLSNLGSYIETHICGGDLALRFDGYDGMSSRGMAEHFSDKVDREIEKMSKETT